MDAQFITSDTTRMTASDRPQVRAARLLIADDRARARRALRAMLATQPGLELVGEAADGEEALTAVEQLRPDIIIMDVRMPRLDGIAAMIQINLRWPRIRAGCSAGAAEVCLDSVALQRPWPGNTHRARHTGGG